MKNPIEKCCNFTLQSYIVTVKNLKVIKSKTRCAYKSDNSYPDFLLNKKEISYFELFRHKEVENGIYYFNLVYYRYSLNGYENDENDREYSWEIKEAEWGKIDENNEWNNYE